MPSRTSVEDPDPAVREVSRSNWGLQPRMSPEVARRYQVSGTSVLEPTQMYPLESRVTKGVFEACAVSERATVFSAPQVIVVPLIVPRHTWTLDVDEAVSPAM